MTLVLSSILLKFLLFLICYLLILKSKKIVTVDLFWPLSFLPEFFIAFIFKGFSHGNVILFGMVLLWALRLSIYLGSRGRKFSEDPRYSKYSESWPKDQFKSQVFKKIIFIQFAVSTLVSSCFYVYLFSPSFGWSAPFWNVPMLGIFLVGFFLEVTADEQMRSFKNKNPNRSVTYTGGVWRFIKYPNYLGEILVWLSFGLLALPFQYGILGLISPITMIYFLTFVSGIPYLEQDRNKKEAFPNPRPLYKYLPFLY